MAKHDPVHAERAGACLAVVEDADDRQRGRADQSRAEALDGARRDEHRGIAGGAAGGRGEREQEQSAAEDPAAAESVAEAPGSDQEDRQGDPGASVAPQL